MSEQRPSLTGFLAIAIVMGFFGIVGILLFHEVPQGSKDILGPLIGVIGAAVGTIVGYHWGSSSGSARKSDLISEMTGTGDGASKTSTQATIRTERVTTVTPEPPIEPAPPTAETPAGE